MKNTCIPVHIILSLLLLSCSDMIEFSQFDADVSGKALNLKSIERIAEHPFNEEDTIKFILFSDTHEFYDDLADGINSMNQQKDISFLLCNGDVTNNGFADQYEWYINIIERSRYPVLTVKGNHDCLANGTLIYERLFGPSNLSFTLGHYKFVIFDNNVLENNNVPPQYMWLMNEMNDEDHHVTFSHLTKLEFSDLHRLLYEQIVDSTNTILGVYGTAHRHHEFIDEGIPTIVSASIDRRIYYIVHLYHDKAEVQMVNF